MNSADRRVWELLQTIDLENLDIATFQGVAAPIFAQKENKEALEALALIAFARMARQGEFNGWLNAGGGGGQAVTGNLTSTLGDNNQTAGQPFGTAGGVLDTQNMSGYNSPKFYPFLSTYTGDLTELTMKVQTADTTGANMLVGIYSSSDDGLPADLLGSTTFDCSTSGIKRNTGFGTITLTYGELYYFAFSPTQTGSNGVIRSWNSLYLDGRINATGGNPEVSYLGYSNLSVTHSLPNPAGVDALTSTERPVFTMV